MTLPRPAIPYTPWMRVTRSCCAAWFGAVLWANVGFAQLPAARLDGIYPAGAQAGTKVELTLTGTNLDDVDQLWFSHAGLSAERKMAEPGPFDQGPQPVPNQFIVHIAADVPPGHYDLRALGLYGLSNPRALEVGTLAEVNEVEPNNQRVEAQEISLPIVANGQINGGTDVDWFRFQANAGERIIARCLASQLDSPLDAVVKIVDESGRVLDESRDGSAGDPLADVTITTTGTYYVQVFDTLFGGNPAYVYRLVLGRLPHVDAIVPPAVVPGTTSTVTVYGRNLPGGQPSPWVVAGRPLEQLQLQINMPSDVAGKLPLNFRIGPEQAGLDGIELPLPGGPLPANRTLVYAATAPVIAEQEPNSTPGQCQKLVLPCEVAAQFYPQRDADWYSFEAKQNEVWSIEVIANRMGSPSDATLLLQRVSLNEAGEEQITQIADIDDVDTRDGGYEFDTRSSDPRYRFVVPADGTYRLLVRDGVGALQADPRLGYRLAIRAEQPDFRLAAIPFNSSDALLMRKGSRELIRVMAFRRDSCTEPIQITVNGLPAGVTASQPILGPAASAASVVLTAAENVEPVLATLEIVGKATIAGQEVARPAYATAASISRGLLQPGQQPVSVPARLSRGLLLSLSREETAAALLSIGDDKVWETSRGGILKIPYTVTRRNEFKGGITGMVTDLPPNINPPQVNIGGDATSGEFQVNLPGNAPTGTYTILLHGFAQGLQYVRNPNAAKVAAERKMEFEKILNDANESVKQKTELRTAAQKTLDETKALTQQATTARDNAGKAATEADNAVKVATETAAKAKQAAAEKTDDANLAQAAATAEQALADAQAKLKAAQEALAVAEKGLAELMTKLVGAEEEKTKAEQALKDAMDFATKAQQAKQAADQRAQQTENEARPRQVNFWTPSTPLTIKIVEMPVTTEGLPQKIALKQGTEQELTIRAARHYGFDGPINYSWQMPGGIGGVQLPNWQIPNGQTEAKIKLVAAANAAVGAYVGKLQTQLNFNGQNVTLDHAVEVTIEAMP